MSRLAFGVGGAALGSFVGQPQLGFALGSLAGGLFNKPDDIVNEGPKVGALPTTTSAFGVSKAIAFGTVPLAGNVIDKSEVRNILHEESEDSGGKGIGGGPEVTTRWYTAELDLDVGICGVPIDAVVRVYANATLLIDLTPGAVNVSPQWLRYKIYYGDEDQLPDPTFEAIRGAGNVPAYRGVAHISFTNFQLESFNNQIPSFRIVVSTNADTGNTTTTKDFGGSSFVGGMVLNPTNSLIYHVNDYPAGGRIGWILDAYSQSSLFNLRWPDDATNIDESGGVGLFSMPVVVSGGVGIELAPNSHFFVQTEDGGVAKTAFFDSLTGEYLGSVEGLKAAFENLLVVISDERKGTMYGQRQSFNGFFSNIQSWSFTLVGSVLGSPITYIDNGTVLIPFGRDGIQEWSWDIGVAYQEGTTRNGSILVGGLDNVDKIQYLCLLDDSYLTNISNIVSVTDGFQIEPNGNALIRKIIWDSVRSLFWAVGEGAGSATETLFRAYDINLNIVDEHVELTGSYHVGINQDGNYSDLTSEIYWIQANNAYSFNTVSLNVSDLGPVTVSGTAQPYDTGAYHHGTGTFWKMTRGHFLDIIKLSAVTENEVLLSSIFNALCKRSNLEPSQYFTSTLDPDTCEGYTIENDGTIRSKMIPMQQAFFIDAVDEGNRINFKFRSTDPIATITETELAVVENSGNSERSNIIIRREMDLKLPGRTELTYYNKEAEFEQNTQIARREASYVLDNSTRIVVPVVMSNNSAMRRADVIEHVSHIEREVYEISTSIKYLFLTVGDVVEIKPNDTDTFVGRIITKSFLGSNVAFVLTRHDASVLQSLLSGGDPEPRDISVANNPLTNSVHLDIPLLLETQNNAGYNIAGGGMADSWNGGNIYKSADRQSWSLLTTLLNTSNLGSTQDALPDSDAEFWDYSSSLIVNTRPGTVLNSCTEEEALQGNINAAVIGVNGRFEMVNFVNAVLTGDNQYTLDTFIRGRIGTELFTADHQVGDIFATLSSDDLTYVTDSLANLYEPFIYRAVSFGQSLYGDQIMEQAHINNGICLIPLAPAQFRAEVKSNLDILFTWMPRTRFPLNNFWSGDESDPDDFELLIYKNSDSSLVRSVVDLTTSEYTYTRDDQISDGLPSEGSELLDCEIYHLSQILTANNRRGYVSTTQVTAGIAFNTEYLDFAISIGATIIWELADPVSSTTVAEYFDNYNGDFVIGANFGLPALFQNYKTSMQISALENIRIENIPLVDASPTPWFDPIDFSVSFMVQPQVAITQVQEFMVFEPALLTVRWNLNGSVTFTHRNFGGDFKTVTWAGPLPIGTTTHFVMTFKSTADGVLGPFEAYVNGVSVGSVQAKNDIRTDIYLNVGYAPFWFLQTDSQRHQMYMFFDNQLSAQQVSDLFDLTGL